MEDIILICFVLIALALIDLFVHLSHPFPLFFGVGFMSMSLRKVLIALSTLFAYSPCEVFVFFSLSISFPMRNRDVFLFQLALASCLASDVQLLLFASVGGLLSFLTIACDSCDLYH